MLAVLASSGPRSSQPAQLIEPAEDLLDALARLLAGLLASGLSTLLICPVLGYAELVQEVSQIESRFRSR